MVEEDEERRIGVQGELSIGESPLGERKCMVLHGKSNGFRMASEDRQFGDIGVWTLDPPPLGERKCMVMHGKSNG